MFKQKIENLKLNLVNIPGWRTKRKIVIMESDDWGSIRMASKKAYNTFFNKGIPVDQCPYNSNDALENNLDMEVLFNTLTSVIDYKGRNAVLTANSLVANPDFEKIKKSAYETYFYENLSETYKKYPNSDKVIDLCKAGIENKIFIPQLHGREHIHINNWLKSLRANDYHSILAFQHNMFTLSRGIGSSAKKENLNSFASYTENDIKEQQSNLSQAIELFYHLWSYKPTSFMAPCYTWQPETETILHNLGIKYIQSGRVQTISNINGKPNSYIRHYTGQKNQHQQIYTVRNVAFEPASNPNFDWVDSALKEISIAFTWHKPAIISVHRKNFIGSINERNRTTNNNLLKQLLLTITQRWPEVEFMSSAELGDTIAKNNN
jgi:hypothetical protein